MNPTDLQVEIVTQIWPGITAAVTGLVVELGSPNQVPVTPAWLQKIVNFDAPELLIAYASRDKILGLAVLVVYFTIVNIRALIETLAVDPAYRRLGVAQELINEAINMASTSGVNTVRVATVKNNHAANALIIKLGLRCRKGITSTISNEALGRSGWIGQSLNICYNSGA